MNQCHMTSIPTFLEAVAVGSVQGRRILLGGGRDFLWNISSLKILAGLSSCDEAVCPNIFTKKLTNWAMHILFLTASHTINVQKVSLLVMMLMSLPSAIAAHIRTYVCMYILLFLASKHCYHFQDRQAYCGSAAPIAICLSTCSIGLNAYCLNSKPVI